MKKIREIFVRLTTCGICFGRGTQEKSNGDTIECVACKGKGFI